MSPPPTLDLHCSALKLTVRAHREEPFLHSLDTSGRFILAGAEDPRVQTVQEDIACLVPYLVLSQL